MTIKEQLAECEKLQTPPLNLEEIWRMFFSIHHERRRAQNSGSIFSHLIPSNRVLNWPPYPANAHGRIDTRLVRPDLHNCWVHEVKLANLPPLKKCAAEVTPRFEPIIDDDQIFPTFFG